MGRITVVGDGAATLRTADGSQLALEGDALLIHAPGSWRLEHGALVVDAARQPPGQHLAIETPRGVVSVIGTRFRVEADPERTWVRVERGHVALSQGVERRELAMGEEGMADAGGVSEQARDAERRLLAPADGAIGTLFDAVTFTPIADRYHGLPLARFDYRESADAHAGFADVSWRVTPATGERRIQAWFRPELVRPKRGNAETTIALLAAMDGCDYLLAERRIAPDERGWVRIDADIGHGRLNWTRAEPAPPLTLAAIRSLSFRAYSGYITGTLAAPALLP